MNSDYDRLKQAAKELKNWDTDTKIAKGLTVGGYAVTPQKLYNWRTRGHIAADAITHVSSVLGVRGHWLMTGEGDMLDAPAHLPVYGYPVHGSTETRYASKQYSPGTWAFIVDDAAMYPMFSPGDVLFIDPEVEPHTGDVVLAMNGHNRYHIRRLRALLYDDDGNASFDLVPQNDDYPTFSTSRQTLRLLGTLVESIGYRRCR